MGILIRISPSGEPITQKHCLKDLKVYVQQPKRFTKGPKTLAFSHLKCILCPYMAYYSHCCPHFKQKFFLIRIYISGDNSSPPADINIFPYA